MPFVTSSVLVITSSKCHASSNRYLTNSSNKKLLETMFATRNKCIASSNKCLTSTNKKLLI